MWYGVGEGWRDLAALLERGLTDSGKSTLCRFLVDELKGRFTVAYVDCDTGQSVVGPPATMGLAMHGGSAGSPAPYLRFVGSISPAGHLLQTVTGAKRLTEKASEAGASVAVIDSPGFVYGGAAFEFQFQFQLIDLLQPTHIVALQRSRELERLLANFRRHPGIAIHRRPGISPAVVPRTATERRAYREARFRMYFAEAGPRKISLRRLGLHGGSPT